MSEVVAECSLQIPGDLPSVFAYVVPVPLESIFRGFGVLPAVLGTRDATGRWDGVGQTRTVLLSDGSKLREELIGYESPVYFGYRVTGFSGVIGTLANHAKGEWWFEQVPGEGSTNVRWRYGFVAQNGLVQPVLALVGRLLWRRYMERALARIRAAFVAR